MPRPTTSAMARLVSTDPEARPGETENDGSAGGSVNKQI